MIATVMIATVMFTDDGIIFIHRVTTREAKHQHWSLVFRGGQKDGERRGRRGERRALSMDEGRVKRGEGGVWMRGG